MNPDIIFEDQDILLCVKPAGVPTQSRRVGTPDMVSILKNHLHASHPQKGEPYLALIHRLDQPAAGLLVFAKTPAAAKSLSQQLQSSGFGKRYLAVLSAIPAQREATLENDLARDGRANVSRVCAPGTPGSKRARLHYKILRTHGKAALAEITLDTGRHHQIRVQMAHIGCPILGDGKYTPVSLDSPQPFPDSHSNPDARSKTHTCADLPAFSGSHACTGQLQLYAVGLSFRHPTTGAPLSFCHTPRLPF